jgi:hypothetical protein
VTRSKGSWGASLLGAIMLAVSAHAADVPNLAINQPDQFSWRLFTQAVTPAATSGNNNVLFETWASDSDTFKVPPQFPATAPSPMSLRAPVLTQFFPRRLGLQPHVLPGGGEEVRRNMSAFRFIVDNNLHTVDGLVQAFADGKPISFPIDAVEVKANWIPADTPGIDSSRYHTNTAPDGKKYALVAMHVISKQIPDWTWATFEQQDNAGRCDFIGCHDDFGATVPNVPAAASAGQKYPPCVKTPAVQAIFTAASLDAVWQNYCLKGSQADFTDSTGRPTHLGNSVTEAGFVNTSSCITCHGRAAVSSAGKATSQAGFLIPPATPVCPTGSPCSPNGTPQPVWFWSNPGRPTQKLVALQTDFIWAIPFCAVPHGQSTGPCSQP